MTYQLLLGDCAQTLKSLPDESISATICSPPYWGLRDYGMDEQIGLEPSPGEYVRKLVEVFREVRRVLRPDGTCWVNLGDSYWNGRGAPGGEDLKNEARRFGKRPQDGPPPPGLKRKDLVGIPWRVAFALQDDGWWLRQCIIWEKPNAMPESATDRCTNSHEYIFLLTKADRYWFDHTAIQEKANYDGRKKTRTEGSKKYTGNAHPLHAVNTIHAEGGDRWQTNEHGEKVRNARSVWSIPTTPSSEGHFAMFPEALAERCLLAGCQPGMTVLDPFAGSGTTGIVAVRHNRSFVGCELNPAFLEMAKCRIERARHEKNVKPSLFDLTA